MILLSVYINEHLNNMELEIILFLSFFNITFKIICIVELYCLDILSIKHALVHCDLTDPGLETERVDIASFVVGSNKSLASQSRF